MVDAVACAIKAIAPHKRKAKVPLPQLPDADSPSKDLLVVEVDVYHLNVADLKDHLRTCKLKLSGKKDELVERLVEFSEQGPDHWRKQISPGAVRNHKGTRDWINDTSPQENNSKPKKRRKLNERQTRLAEGAKQFRPEQNFPVERSKDTRTESEINNIIPWAKHVMELVDKEDKVDILYRHSHLPSSAPNNKPSTHQPLDEQALVSSISTAVFKHLAEYLPLTAPNQTTTSSVSRYDKTTDIAPTTAHILSTTTPSVTTAGECLPAVPTQLPGRGSDMAMVQLTTHTPTLTCTISSTAPSVSALSDGTTPIFSDPPAVILQVSTDEPRDLPIPTKAIIFANGEKFTFADSEVPPTVPIRYAESPDELIRVWSDGDEWPNPRPCDFPVCVRGRPIPLKYWRQLYRFNKEKEKEWKHLKTVWYNYRYFMTEYYRDGEVAFWARFTKDGRRLSFTKITQILLDERKAAASRQVTKIKEEYGDEFEREFCYYNSRRRLQVVMSDTAKIVKLYRQKKGLSNEDDDDD